MNKFNVEYWLPIVGPLRNVDFFLLLFIFFSPSFVVLCVCMHLTIGSLNVRYSFDWETHNNFTKRTNVSWRFCRHSVQFSLAVTSIKLKSKAKLESMKLRFDRNNNKVNSICLHLRGGSNICSHSLLLGHHSNRFIWLLFSFNTICHNRIARKTHFSYAEWYILLIKMSIYKWIWTVLL